MSYMYVLNGDATLSQLRQSRLRGGVVVCREMMSEGKVKNTKDPVEFFESRAKHLEFQYGIDKQTYYTNVVHELEKLKNSSSFDEIVLWFEADLFCQINLVFIIIYLKNNLDTLPPISIVDMPHHREVTDYPSLLEQRVLLQPADIQLAFDTWEAYCEDTPLALEKITRMEGGNLKYLPAALRAHLERFPDVESGLSSIEKFFLRKLSLGKYRNYDLYTAFWDELWIYGFGDFQLDLLIQRMQQAGVIENEAQMISITSLGQEVLNNEENYLDYLPLHHRWLGGVRLDKTPWRWDPSLQKIIKKEQ
ncbi:DUF1835 domain-containing protein [Chitinophaga flava]|nr:hypothetical protein [Chitinophaga flava]